MHEALKRRRMLVDDVNSLGNRIANGMTYHVQVLEDGTKAEVEQDKLYDSEEFQAMRETWNKKSAELRELKKRICKANQIQVDGTCVQDLVIELGEVKAKIAQIEKMRIKCDRDPYAERDRVKRYLVTPKELDAEIDQLKEEAAGIDLKITALNAKIELP